MSKKRRRRFDAQLKTKVALEALRDEATIADLAAKYQLHRDQIARWRNGGFCRRQRQEGEPRGHRALRQDRAADDGARFFITEVRAMNRAERLAMVNCSWADLSVTPYQTNPLVYRGVMYVTIPRSTIAIDATFGATHHRCSRADRWLNRAKSGKAGVLNPRGSERPHSG